MALNIKDPETDELVRRLARLTGESITDAIKGAVRERIKREDQERSKPGLDELMAIARRCAARPVLDPRPVEEILDWDEHGLPR